MSRDVAEPTGEGAGSPRRPRAVPGGALVVAATALLAINSVWLAVAVEPGTLHLVSLVLHPLLGVAVAVPLAIGWWRRRGERWLFAGGALLAASALAGLALAVAGHRLATRPLLWAHLGLAAAGLIVLAAALARRPRASRLATAAALVALAVVALAGAAWPRPMPPALPAVAAAADAAGEAMGGAAGPFYPSPAHTTTGAPLAAAELPPAAACAGSGCHDDLVAEWRSSPHALSGAGDPWYLAARSAAGADAGEAAVRWCAACHEPARLATAAAAPAAAGEDGVTCAVCHRAVGSRNAAGSGGWVLAPAPLADFAAATGGWRRAVHALAIRLDPEPHRRSFAPAALAAAETCAACHKGRYGEPVNGHRPFGELNDYDTWQASSISGEGGRSFRFPERPQTCAECHLPRRDGGGRSHRFASSNRALADLSGDPEQARAVDEALAAAGFDLALFALVDDEGTVRRLAEGAALEPGRPVRLDVVVSSRGAGHTFPGGKTDAVEAWVELSGVDRSGRVVFASGRIAPESGGEPAGDAHFYRRRVVDGEARPLERRELWRARATVYDRQLQPLMSDVVRYRLEPPEVLHGPVTLTARLHYRPISAAFHRWAREQPEGAALPERVPSRVLAEARAGVPVAAAATPAADGLALAAAAGPASPAAPAAASGAASGDAAGERQAWYDYGTGLTLQGDLRGARGAFQRTVDLDPDFVDGWINLGRTALAEGDLEAAETALARAQELAPDLARTLYHLGRLAQLGGDVEAAESRLRRAAELYPRDRLIRLALAQIVQAKGDQQAVVEEMEAILAVDPEWSVPHFNLMMAHKALGDEEASAHHQALFERFRPDDTAQATAGPYLETHPDDNRERQPIHEHPTTPAAPAATTTAAGGAAP
jgi:hypothetical protein